MLGVRSQDIGETGIWSLPRNPAGRLLLRRHWDYLLRITSHVICMFTKLSWIKLSEAIITITSSSFNDPAKLRILAPLQTPMSNGVKSMSPERSRTGTSIRQSKISVIKFQTTTQHDTHKCSFGTASSTCSVIIFCHNGFETPRSSHASMEGKTY